jgi:hypothetical protein
MHVKYKQVPQHLTVSFENLELYGHPNRHKIAIQINNVDHILFLKDQNL